MREIQKGKQGVDCKMDNLFEFFFGLFPFAVASIFVGVSVNIWEKLREKKNRQQAENKRRTDIRHAEDMDKLQQTKQIKLLYYDTLLH